MVMKKSQTLVLVTLFVFILGLSGFWLYRSSKSPMNQLKKGEVTSLQYEWKQGQKYLYHFRFDNSSNADFTKLFTQTTDASSAEKYSLKVVWEGEYTLSVIDQKSDSTVLKHELTLKNFQFYSPDNPIFIASDKLGQMRRELILPFFTEVDNHGLIKKIKFQANLDRNTLQLLKNIIAITQLQFAPFEKASTTWSTTENDLQGAYLAHYAIDEEASQKSHFYAITKTKKKYASNRARNNLHKSVGDLEITKKVVANSEWSILFDPSEKRLQAIKGRDLVTTSVNGNPLAENSSEISLQLVKASEVEFNQIQMDQTTLASDKSGEVPYQSLSQNLQDSEMERLIQKQELGTLTLNDLTGMLKKYYQEKDDKSLEKLYLKIKALIYLEPSAALALAALLKEFEANSLGHNLILRALGSIGNEEAQAALLVALKEASDEKKKVNTIFEIGTLKNPNEAVESSLFDIIKQGKTELTVSSAGLALGIMAGTLSAINPEREKRIILPMLNDYESATTNAQKIYLLSVFGNSGSVYAENSVIDAAKDPSVEVQAEALKNLRFFKNEATTDLLIDNLQSSKDDLRSAAIFALAFKEPSKNLYEAQKNQFVSEKNGSNRRELFKNLWELKTFDPSVKTFLQDQRAVEKDPEFSKMMDSYFMSASEN